MNITIRNVSGVKQNNGRTKRILSVCWQVPVLCVIKIGE